MTDDTDYWQPHYDPDTPTPLPPCGCAHCRTEGRLDQTPDCIHWRN